MATIYVRISLDHSGDGLGVQRQEEACRELAERLGLTVDAVYSDNSVSAFKRKHRPGFEAMLATRPDVIICWAADRLYRQPKELEGLIDRLGSTVVHTVAGGAIDLSTSEGKLVARLVGAVAAAESERKGERIAAQKRQARAQGKLVGGGRRKFGWEQLGVVENGPRAGKPTGPLTLVEHEAQFVRDAATMLLSGLPMAEVLRVAHERNLRTPGAGNLFSHGSLRQMLCNPMLHANGGTAEWPAILTEQQHSAVVAILTSRRATSRVGSRKSLLAGLLVCGGCGGRLYMGASGLYRCVARGCASVRARELEDLVGDAMVGVLQMQEPPKPVVTPDEEGREVLLARLEGLASLVADGVLSPADYATAAGIIREKLAGFEVALPSEDPRAVAEAWGEISDERRRALLEKFIGRIVIAPGVRGKKGFDPARVAVEWVPSVASSM